MTRDITVTIASRTGLYIYSLWGPFNTASFGFGETNRDAELSALSAALSAIPYRPFANFILGRNAAPNSKLPITVQTCSQALVDTVNSLVANDAATVKQSPLHGHVARILQGYSVTWQLLDPTDHIITDLEDWAARLVQG